MWENTLSDKSIIKSKSRTTLPISGLRQLGLHDGDVLEFTLEAGVTTMQRFAPDNNPFTKWAGRLGEHQRLKDAVQWQRDLRDET